MIILQEEIESFLSAVLKRGDYQKVKIEKTSALPDELKIKLKKYLKYWQPKKKECFNNAFHVMSVDSEIQYVDGVIQIQNGIPIEHAWNCYQGTHFDLTSEILFNGNLSHGEEAYYELFKTNDVDEVIKRVNSSLGPIQLKRKK